MGFRWRCVDSGVGSRRNCFDEREVGKGTQYAFQWLIRPQRYEELKRRPAEFESNWNEHSGWCESVTQRAIRLQQAQTLGILKAVVLILTMYKDEMKRLRQVNVCLDDGSEEDYSFNHCLKKAQTNN